MFEYLSPGIDAHVWPLTCYRGRVLKSGWRRSMAGLYTGANVVQAVSFDRNESELTACTTLAPVYKPAIAKLLLSRSDNSHWCWIVACNEFCRYRCSLPLLHWILNTLHHYIPMPWSRLYSVRNQKRRGANYVTLRRRDSWRHAVQLIIR